MRLSTKGRYAVMAMADLAGNATNAQIPGEPRPVALADIAARQDISLSYLEQLFAKLRREGKLVFAGRTTNAASTGFIILKNMTEAEARAVLAEDPAVRRGIMSAEFQPFQTALKEKK